MGERHASRARSGGGGRRRSAGDRCGCGPWAVGAAQRPVRARAGRRGLAGARAGRPPRRAAVRRHAARAVRPRLAPAAGRRRARARGVGGERPVVQRLTGRPPGHRGRVQGLPLRRHPRPRVRLLRHDADVPAQRAQPGRRVGRRGRARHVQPGAPRANGHTHDDPDALAARVTEPQPQARPAGRGQRQPHDGARVRLDLRRPRGLPPPRAAVERTLRALRPRERLLVRRQDLLRHQHRAAGDHGDRRHRSQGAARDLAGQRLLPRDDGEQRRQPRVHRGPQGQHADPRHEPDPGAQAHSAGS